MGFSISKRWSAWAFLMAVVSTQVAPAPYASFHAFPAHAPAVSVHPASAEASAPYASFQAAPVREEESYNINKVIAPDREKEESYNVHKVIAPDREEEPYNFHKVSAPYASFQAAPVAADLENQLYRTQEKRVNSLIKENCTVELASYGQDDSYKYSCVKTSGGSSHENPTAEDFTYFRGLSTFELDTTTCTTRNGKVFDTMASADNRVQLLKTMESAKDGTIIVGVTADSVEDYANAALQKVVGPFFTKYNMNINGLEIADKFAFIIQKGYPKKTIFKRERGTEYEETLKMTILLRGSTERDVIFQKV